MGTRNYLGAIIVTLSMLCTGSAQSANLEELQAQVDGGDVEAMIELGKALLSGTKGIEKDTAAGLGILEQAVATGNIRAAASLGKILFDGYYVEPDYDRGARLLGEAATSGDIEAQTSLGAALLWGINVTPDPARAAAFLSQAAEQGDMKAKRLLGQQLVGGWDLGQDVEKGLPMLELAAAEGDAKAKVALGSFLLYGEDLPLDRERALLLFAEAAEAGDGIGLMRYGSWMMWSGRNPEVAERYLRRAGELGVGQAWTTLASGAMWGYLGPKSRRKFDEFAAKALAAGETKIAVLQAKRQMWGISMRADGPSTIAGLEAAASEGNPEALIFLVGLVRNGNRLNIRKDTRRARDYLEQFSGVLSPHEATQLAFSIDVASAKDTRDYKALATQLENQPELLSEWFAEELFRANPNFAVYLLQADMRRDGIYRGKLNGLATRSTLRALLRECDALESVANCSDAVLRAEVIGSLLARRMVN